MNITLLGTGSPIPDPLRAGPATLVRSTGGTMLVDCGRGVLMRLAGAGVLPPMLSALLLTHLHSAHHADLTWRPSVEVTEVTPGDTFTVGSADVRVGATDHRPVEPTVAYRVDDDGRSVVLGGDGVPCAGLDELCQGADVYVQTVIRDDLVRLVPNARFQDIVDYHSTVQDAARTAKHAGVSTLVLTHYVPPM